MEAGKDTSLLMPRLMCFKDFRLPKVAGNAARRFWPDTTTHGSSAVIRPWAFVKIMDLGKCSFSFAE